MTPVLTAFDTLAGITFLELFSARKISPAAP